MDLTRSIKRDRAQQKRKRPHERQVFTAVSRIVEEYKLGSDFLKSIDSIDGCFSQRGAELCQGIGKKPLEVPPYILVSQDEYGIVMAIISSVNNPYLRFAHSPEEMLLSALLYEVDPSVPSEDLVNNDFQTLLHNRQAKGGPFGDSEK